MTLAGVLETQIRKANQKPCTLAGTESQQCGTEKTVKGIIGDNLFAVR
jgi:hypothetical protein